MSIEELDMIIDWCRKKIAYEKWTRRLNSKTLDGYEIAMNAVMNHLHSLKKEKVNHEQS